MNNILEYYYNLNKIDIINMEKNFIIFDNNDYSYLLYEVEEKLDLSNNIKILKNISKSFYGDVIINNNGSYITKIEDKYYVLIKLKGIINDTISLNEMINNNIKFRIVSNNVTDLSKLWSEKVDYLEYQVSQLAGNYDELLDSFSFFIGLCENAISFLNINKIDFNNTHKTISHQRINNDMLFIDYYNPLKILIDYDIRDYAEYIKSKLLVTDDIDNDIKIILNNAKLSTDDLKLFYARLMFPTNYLDKVGEILIDNKEEKELDIFIEIIPRYINMLKDVYYEITKKGISIDIPNWIIKN